MTQIVSVASNAPKYCYSQQINQNNYQEQSINKQIFDMNSDISNRLIQVIQTLDFFQNSNKLIQVIRTLDFFQNSNRLIQVIWTLDFLQNFILSEFQQINPSHSDFGLLSEFQQVNPSHSDFIQNVYCVTQSFCWSSERSSKSI